jgi:hypothetical protein
MKKQSFVKSRKNTSKNVFKPDIKLLDIESDEDSDSDIIFPVVNIIESAHTKISDILKLDSTHIVSFYDRIHNPKKWIITMFDLISMKQLPSETKICCYWCRNSFSTSPIGCPIKIVDSEFIEKWIYKSNDFIMNKSDVISNRDIDKYKSIFPSFYGKLKEDCGNIENYMKINKSGKFIVTKIFCSFNCTQAFINEELLKCNFMYKNSTHLLANMYKCYTGDYYTEKIPEAPSYELLLDYGGKLSISEFRASFMSVTYSKVKNIYFPVGSIYSEEIIF